MLATNGQSLQIHIIFLPISVGVASEMLAGSGHSQGQLRMLGMTGHPQGPEEFLTPMIQAHPVRMFHATDHLPMHVSACHCDAKTTLRIITNTRDT